jgi:hypothetical protein
MRWKPISATLICALALLAGPVRAADVYPLAQGLHQWSASGGKLMLVVGTYQDTTTYRRSYAFYFKTAKDDAWNQVAVPASGSGEQFTWNSASHGEFTLADGIAVQRPDGVYFVVADKPMARDAGYADKRDVNVTWYKLTLADDDHPDDVPYQFKSAFRRSYPRSTQTVDAILAREAALQPRK